MTYKSLIKWIAFGVILIFVISLFNIDREAKQIEDLNNIGDPIQKRASGEFDMEIGDWDVDVEYVAEYVISGRVVNTYHYNGNDFEAILSPVDVGLVWGELVNDNKIEWYSTGDRFLRWKVLSDVTKELGGKKYIQRHFSNNHLMPANEEISELIKDINVDDYITIKGYLVDVYAERANGSYIEWDSSTSRKDSGGGACELVYVEDVKWLK